MAAKRKPYKKLQCQECKRINYHAHKSKQLNNERKLELKKFCKFCRKYTVHKEAKK